MQLDAWKRWWNERGEERLTLLLWALWNPTGPVALDEYASYAGPVASILRSSREEDPRFSASLVQELSSHLGRLRESVMEVSLDPAVEKHAAEVLLLWYRLEMEALEG